MDIMRKIIFFSVLFFGIDACATCSAVSEKVRNQYASDLFNAFMIQSYGKSTLAQSEFNGARLRAKEAGENILNLIAIEQLFVWYRMYGKSLRLFYQNPTGDDRINGEYKPYYGSYPEYGNYSEWGNNPEQARLVREFMFGVAEIISGVFCATVSGGALGWFAGGVAIDGAHHIYSALNSLWTQHQVAMMALKNWEQTSLKAVLE